jgi:hypothetical protein
VTPNDERKSLSVRATNMWDLLIVFIRSRLVIVLVVLGAIAFGILKLDMLKSLIDLIKGL